MAANGRQSAASIEYILAFIESHQGTVNRIADAVNDTREDVASLKSDFKHLQKALDDVTAREARQGDRRFQTIMNVVGWVVAAVSLAVAILK